MASLQEDKQSNPRNRTNSEEPKSYRHSANSGQIDGQENADHVGNTANNLTTSLSV